MNQSIRAPEALTTGAHLAISLFTNSANCAGVFGEKRAPSFGSRAWISGEAMIRMASEFHRWTMSAGVPEGANRPIQLLT